MGIIINRPVEDRSLASLLEALGDADTGIVGSVRIFAGVEPEIGFAPHIEDYHRPETVDIDGRVAMTSSPEVLRDIGRRTGPEKEPSRLWLRGLETGPARRRAWPARLGRGSGR